MPDLTKLLPALSVFVLILTLIVGNTPVDSQTIAPIAKYVAVKKPSKRVAHKPVEIIKAKVVEIHDGDTFFIPYSGKGYKTSKDGLLKVRLHIADTPEYDDHRAYFQQPYGKEAQLRVKKLLLGNEVTLMVGKKSYERPVCDVFIGDKNLAILLLKEGLAWVDPRYIKTKDSTVIDALNINTTVDLLNVKDEDRDLISALNEARTARKGVWSQRNPESPWDFRERIKAEAKKRRAKP